MAKKKKSNGGRVWAVILLMLLAGGGAYLYFQPSQVTVPSLVGKSEEQAVQALKKLKLRAEVQKEEASESEVQGGQVLKQAPAASVKVPRGSVVTIFVADKPQTMEIPNIVGKTRSEAEDILTRLGLKVKFKEAKSQTVEIGRVISQQPAAGPQAISKGESVTLTVSGGRGKQKVPDLRELTPEFARNQLKKVGLELVVLEVVQPGFRAGDPVRILRQEPKAGSALPPGSRVTVFIPIPAPAVDRPSDPTSASVHAPHLEGLTVAQARKVAQAEGVELEFADSASDSSVITFQEPPPGDPLPKGENGVLVQTRVSAVVPGLAGLSEAEARQRIESAELTVGSVDKTYGPVKGEVLGQRPSPGIEVVGGTAVDIVIADPSLTPDSARVNQPDPLPTPAFTPAPWVGDGPADG